MIKRYFSNLFWTVIVAVCMIIGALFGISLFGEKKFQDTIKDAYENCTKGGDDL